MHTYKIARTHHYTEYFLIQVENEEQVEDGTVADLIKMDTFEPYFIDSERNDGDMNWEECTEEESHEIERVQGITREIVEAEEPEYTVKQADGAYK